MKQIIFTAILIFAFCFAAYAQTNENSCPIIDVISPAGVVEPTEPVSFIAEVGKETEKFNIEYIWTVKGGKILEGQGTKSIKALMDECGDTLTATLEIKGLPQTCPFTASETYAISHNCELMRSIPIDGYGKLTVAEEETKMDNFITKLQKEITAEGVIELPNDKNLIRHLKWLNNYLITKKADKTRISYAISDSDKRETWLWLVSPVDKLPNCYNCLIIKAEDSKELNKIFKSKSKNRKK